MHALERFHARNPSRAQDRAALTSTVAVTSTNFEKVDRLELQKWVEELCGATFTSNLKSKVNTHVLAKFEGGEKVTKARDWGLGVYAWPWLFDSLCNGTMRRWCVVVCL